MFLNFSKRCVFLRLLVCMLGSVWLLTTLPEAHAQRVKYGKYGDLGKVTVKKALIRSAPNPAGRILSHAPQGTYVAIKKGKGNYYGVWMADGSTGYMLKREVEIIDYTVVTPKK